MENYAELMFTEAVQDLQEASGTKHQYERAYPSRTQEALSANDVAFIKARDSFYIATVNSDGWPYIQHRGGAPGFVHVAGPTTLACADYPGNKQFISMGNLKTDPRVSLFFMDYMNHARLKVQGNATLIDATQADPMLLDELDQRRAPAERVLKVEVVAMDWNCPKYIPTLYSGAAIQEVIGPKMAALQAENEELRAEIERLKREA
ncbi:MAG: pyridoxamine 5'-phosphate oxidase family protein [Pseudomonadota bacterium]